MQQTFFEGEYEDPAFLSTQLLTYIGNKRALLGTIDGAIRSVRERLGGRTLAMFDPFAGSGAVSRLMKQHSHRLVSNDLEAYSAAVGRAYLTNRDSVDVLAVRELVDQLNATADKEPVTDGFIRRLYSPSDDSKILKGERAFYTTANAQRLDTYIKLVHGLDPKLHELLLGPLLVKASVHANTGGVFKGFYKDKVTGVGKFGGTNADALSRITQQIRLEVPVLSQFNVDVDVYQQDAGSLARDLSGFDLTYLDPPYNQHPYGSNYFMLNLIARNEEPSEVSRVSGIPTGWQRSAYNVRREARLALGELIKNLDTRFVLISYSDEGFISPEEMRGLLADFGTTTVSDIRYPTYRASRNLSSRALSVTEHLYLLERN